MKNVKALSLILVGAALLVGCKPENPDLAGQYKAPKKLEPVRYTSPPKVEIAQPAPAEIPTFDKVVQPPKTETTVFDKVDRGGPAPTPQQHERYVQDDEITMKYNPKVDVLFVMDTSDSMSCDQAKLQSSIDQFVSSFLKNEGRLLDFHIGVTTAWDSVTFGDVRRDCELGQLRPVGGGTCTSNGGNAPYVTRETKNLTSTLGKTLKVGIEKFIKDQPSRSGPEFEEMFSPVKAALSAEAAKMNGDFRRDDAHLAVVMVTDTDDSTPSMSPSEIASFLRSKASANVSVSTFAVLARYDDLLKFQANPTKNPLTEYPRAAMDNCSVNPVDPAIRLAGKAPFRMQQFLVNTGGTGFDLKDAQYGKKLAALGDQIVRKSLRKVIALDHVPDLNQPIVVKYGKQTIPRSDATGWSYDQEQQTLIINEGVKLQPEEGARLVLEYTPVNL